LISCTCPDAFKRKDHQLRLCKHSYACLHTLIDWDANQIEIDKRKEEYLKEVEAAAAKRSRDKLIEEQQEERLPGERARLMHGLKVIPSNTIVQKIKQKISESVENLELLSKIFDVIDMPHEQSKPCYRCGHKYDPHYKSTCRMPHPKCCVTVDQR